MNRLNGPINSAVAELIKTIRSSEEYKEYNEIREKVISDESISDLVRRSNEIRNKIYSIPEHERQNDYANGLISEYEDICENTLVYRYSHSEIKMGEIFREIVSTIQNEMDME